jgi:putative phosphonate catabolism associated alcohol dehydrogenase
MSIQAMLFDGAGQPLRSVTYPKPVLCEGEALVRVRLCTLCGSDLHTFFGRRTEPTPAILGHEIIGTLEELGPNTHLESIDGESLQLGDRITWSVAAACGSCYFCTRNLPQKCEKLRKYGHIREQLHGGLATHCHLLKGTAIVKIPEHLSDETACPAMCATATAAAAIRAGEEVLAYPQPVALIVGAGLLGCTVCAMLASRGVTVLIVDLDPNRLEQAKAFGASQAIQPEKLKAVLSEVTEGRGADLGLEISGSLGGVELAYSSVRIGGSVVLIGTVSPTPSMPLFPEKLVRRCLTIRGVHNYAPADLLRAVQFLAEHGSRFPFTELGPRYPLSQAEQAFHHAEQHRPTRVLIDC